MKKHLFLIPLVFLASCAKNTGFLVPEQNRVPLPDITVRDQYDRQISLRSYADSEYTLLFFYPEASTPG